MNLICGGVRETRLWSLPEGCLSEILCRTTPRDVCRLSATSPAFNAAAQSDSVWSAFLPSDVDEVIASAADRLGSLSRRDLFFRLCRSPILLLNSMSFSLDKESGRKCYMIPSSMLFDAIGRTLMEWKRAQFWKSGPLSLYCPRTNSMIVFPCGSRIGLIQGKIKASLLSPSTTYSAYLIFELRERSSDYYPVSVAVNYVKTGKHEMKLDNKAYLTAEAPLVVPMPNCWNFPLYRDDGWMEVRMGEFYNDGVDDGDDNEVELVLKSCKALVSTLHVWGVELRPTDM